MEAQSGMPLSNDEVDAHIGRWEAYYRQQPYPHRVKWPSRLFHHAPLENAVSILQQGFIRARNDPENNLPLDVAGADIINLRDHAHNSVRFYFRPRTPTQFHVEGVRKVEDCRDFDVHAPILVMFVFKAKPILTAPGTRFSDENMQRGSAILGENNEFFQTIPFAKVYHEGGLCGDRSIIAHRCAEVLSNSPLPLDGNLQWIYCRSEAERQTLLFNLGATADQWSDRIRVSDDIKVFHRLLSYVEHVHLSSKGIVYELHPRNDGKRVEIAVNVYDQIGDHVISFENDDFSPYPPNGKRWYTKGNLIPNETYHASIDLEGHRAFEARLSFGDTLI